MPEGLVTTTLDGALARMRGETRREREDPAPQAGWLRPGPRAGERGRANDVQDLIRERRERREQGVATEIIDGGRAEAELIELLDSLFDERARVVRAPRREGVPVVAIGEHVGDVGPCRGLESQRVGDERVERPVLDGAERRAVERPRGRPVAVGFLGGAPGPERAPDIRVIRHLEHEVDPEPLQQRTIASEKKPLSSRTVICATPACRRRATSSGIHSSAPAAVCAAPGRHRTPRQSPVSRKARSG